MTNTLPSPVQVITLILRAIPAVIEHLSEDTIKAIKAAGYDGIRTVMRSAVFGSVFGYLSGSGSAGSFQDRMALAVSRAYIETAEAAWVEGGAELPLDDETAAWARGQLDAQLDYVDELFETLKELRKAGDFDAGEVANARADGYASALDGFYNEAVLRGSKNKVVYWQLGETEKHCKDCASLSGKGHKINWFIERDYIPRKNGAAMECGGYNCDCSLVDKDGNEVTL
jgi:hypothetical protein